MDQKTLREEAMREYDRLSQPGTTVHAVAHARQSESSDNNSYSSNEIMKRFRAVFPAQQAAFDEAVKLFKQNANDQQ